MPVSRADLFFNQPRVTLFFELPLSMNWASRGFAVVPVPDVNLPDPPPKAFSS